MSMLIPNWLLGPRRWIFLALVVITLATIGVIRVRTATITLAGQVLAGGKPVGSFWLGFSRATVQGSRHAKRVVVQTDHAGQFAAVLDSTGEYEVHFLPRRFLPAGVARLAVHRTPVYLKVEIPNTALVLQAASAEVAGKPWQVHLFSTEHGLRSSADLMGFVQPSDLALPIVGLPPGLWQLFADTLPNYVARGTNRIELSEGRVAHVEFNWVVGVSTVDVVDDHGMPVPGAQVMADGKRFAGDDRGRVTLTRVSPLKPIIIRADGMSSICVLAPAPDEGRQVRMRRALPRPLGLNIGPETNWPFGFFRSESDKCLIPSKVFPHAVRSKEQDRVQVDVMGLSDGDYAFLPSVSGAVFPGLKSGKTAEVIAPMGCASCSIEYPVAMTPDTVTRRR